MKRYATTPNVRHTNTDNSKQQVATSVRNEIRDALNQGKVVTVHEKPLDYHGWKGSVYIILDPDTAAGAYKISGGANGSFLSTLSAAILGALEGYF